MHGGLTSFKDDHLLFTKLTWSFIALPGPLTGFDLASEAERGLDDLNNLVVSRKKFIVDRIPTSQAEMDHLKDSKRSKAFKSPALRSLLQVRTPEYPTERNCRLAIILFLTTAMQFYGDFSSATEFYMENLYQHLHESHDDSALSPAHLLWFLIRFSAVHSITDQCTKLWVEVIRMKAALLQLGTAKLRNVETVLFSSLENPETFEGKGKFSSSEQSSQIEAEQAEQEVYDYSIPPDCFCELLWFTAPSKRSDSTRRIPLL